MALSLNTSHPLYADLITLIGVDGGVVVDLKGGSTCTPDASVTFGTGTYGAHFTTNILSSNARGVALSPGFRQKPAANPVGTTFVVFNNGNSGWSRGQILDTTLSSNKVGPAVYTAGKASVQIGTGTPLAYGTANLLGTGAHSICYAVNGSTAAKLATDGVNDFTGSVNWGNAGDFYDAYIGGAPSGGYGGFAADYVWVAHFRKYLSDAEILSLHNSLGASNAFGLVASSAVTATLATTTDASVFAGLASVSPLTVLTATLADAVFSGASGSSAVASMALTMDSAVFSGTASVSGSASITLPALKNNTGTLLASESGATVYVYATTGAHVVTKTGQTTNSSGVMTITDAALVASTQYRVVIVLASGAEGMDKVTAA